jgi:hypothetical protein
MGLTPCGATSPGHTTGNSLSPIGNYLRLLRPT